MVTLSKAIRTTSEVIPLSENQSSPTPSRSVRLFLLTQRLDEKPHELVSVTTAREYVAADLAKWHSGGKAIKLTTLQKPTAQLKDASSSMHARVSERIVAGSHRHSAILNEWKNRYPKGTQHDEPRRAA